MASSVFTSPGVYSALTVTTLTSTTGNVTTVNATTVNTTDVVASGDVKAATYHVGASAGVDASITTAGLVGKTITVSKGVITGFV
jgi:hypothetical protein